MNKITPHLLRDLDATLPAGTECYLYYPVRTALTQYRQGKQPDSSINRDQAIPLLAKRLGRGLKRFLVADIRRMLPSQPACQPERMA